MTRSVIQIEEIVDALKAKYEEMGENEVEFSLTSVEDEKELLQEYLKLVPLATKEFEFIISSRIEKDACFIIGSNGIDTFVDFTWIYH